MASPFGHAFIGAMVARRLGVRDPRRLALASIAASLPDIDIIISIAMHGDPLRMHRKGTHTFAFALTAGAFAGAIGLLGRGRDGNGGRDLIADTLTGAAIVGSHVPLDIAPIPRIAVGPIFAEMYLANWLLDLALWGALATALWPRARRATARQAPPVAST